MFETFSLKLEVVVCYGFQAQQMCDAQGANQKIQSHPKHNHWRGKHLRQMTSEKHINNN
jgi:hypothetical protein